MGMISERPAYLKTAQKSLTTVLAAGLGRAQPPRISLYQDRFTVLMANDEPHPMLEPSLSLDVIIVGGNEHVSRIYYKEAFNKDAPAAPVCFSDNGVGPSTDSSEPQNATCSGCPKAQWTQMVDKGNGKIVKKPWCSTQYKLAVLVAGAGDTVFLLGVPATSIKETYKPFMNSLASEGIEPYQVITHLTLENKQLHFTLLPYGDQPLAWVPEEMMNAIVAIVDSDDVDVVVGAKDKAIESMPAKPQIGNVPPAAMQDKGVPYQEPFAVRPPTVPMTAAQAEGFTAPKRGRPRKETIVPPGPIAPNTFAAPKQTEMPFIRPEPAPAPRGGIETPQEAPGNLSSMLTKAFGLKLTPKDDGIPF